jgi:hypothetical protein
MSKDDKNIPRYWKDHTKPVSLEAYAGKLMQELEDRPIELKPEDFELPWGWDLETIEAAYDLDRVRDRLREGEYTFNRKRAKQVDDDRARYAVPRNGQEIYHFYSPNASGGYNRTELESVKNTHMPDLAKYPGADLATLDAPVDAEFGVHGHPYGRGFQDHRGPTGGYGDTKALSLNNPKPMAVVITLQDGPNRGQQVVGYQEMVNGRLQFRVPVGVLSDPDRKAIQHNLNAAQTRFYKP